MLHRTARLAAYLAAFAILLAALFVPASAAEPGAPLAAPTAPVGGVLSIPISQVVPKADGNCSEYGDAVALPFSDGGGKTGTVFLKHNGTLLFVCMKANPGTFKERFGSLYLDPQGDGAGYDYAKQDDYAMRVGIPGTTKRSFNGTGVANGYAANAAIVPFWDGASTTNPEVETVEWQVSMGRFFVNQCQVFGLAAYHHWFGAVGDDYGWP